MPNTTESERSNDDRAAWKSWCRLCAKEDAKSIHIPSSQNFIPLNTTGIGGIVDFIGEFLRINIKNDVDLPQLLCIQCVALVSALVKYVEHIKQVQQMYDVIRLTTDWKPIDIRMLREKYNLVDGDTYTFKMLSPFHMSSNKNTKKRAIERIFVADIPDSKDKSLVDNTVVKNEITPDEVQSEFIPLEAEHKVEFEDPIGDVNQNLDSDSESCDSDESKIDTVNKYSETSFIEQNSKEINNVNRSKKKLRCTEDATVKQKYFCAICSLYFQRVGNYRVHMKKRHETPNEPLTCPQCSKSFKSKFKLYRHIQTHRPPEEKKIFPCPQCERKFQTKDYVTKHIKFVHEDIRPFICEECGEAVRTETTLKEHMLIHTDYAPFECDVCKKGFKNQYRLKNHKEMHSAEKHICTECGLQLNSRVTLNRHMLVHSDVMRHKCDYCGRAFKRAKTLKNHLILHSGLKPYSCDFCERTFATGANCRTHKRKSHPEELAALEAAGTKPYTKNIPKLSVLKTVTRSAENLLPVVSKNSGNFSLKRRPKASSDSSVDQKTSSIEKHVAHSTSMENEIVETVQSKSQTSITKKHMETGNLQVSNNIPSALWKY